MNHQSIHRPRRWAERQCTHIAIGFVCASLLLHASNAPAFADSLSRSADVHGTPSAIWSVIGPFCAIKNWHPAIATCTQDGGNPPTRTLVTRDGKTTFVEPQTARNDADHFYSYSFKSSPFPVTHYMGTIWVVSAGPDSSTVMWTGSYTPVPGKEKEANNAFAGVYDAGLAALKTRFSH